MAETVTIHEVGPRDGLQNEPGTIPVDRKVALIDALVDAGLRRIEVGSFVSPKWVPQMAGSRDVLAAVTVPPGGQFDVLIPNLRGWEDFCAASRSGAYGIAVFVSASEGFSRANLNCSISESLERLRPVVAAAGESETPVRGYVSCVTDCPFDGQVAPGAVADVVAQLRGLSDMPISLGDTIGRGTPQRVSEMLEAVMEVAPVATLAGHFHDTAGRALENVAVSLDAGLRAFDGAAGGLGGCPYAPGAPGNLATEALVAFCEARGFKTGIDQEKLAAAGRLAQAIRQEARNADP